MKRVIVLAWALFGLMLGQQVYALQAGAGGPASTWSHAIVLELHYCMLWALATPFVLRLGRAFPLVKPAAQRGPRFWWRAAVHLPASIACAALVQLAHGFVLPRLVPAWFPALPLEGVLRSVASNVDYGFMLYWIVLLIGQAFEAQLRQAELHEQLAEAQLQALRMQMHPHFLFNALNSIAELIHESPATAERMVTGLGELLRIYLRSGETQLISLAKEVDFVRRYLEIERLRFDGRLGVEIELTPEVDAALVPSLILQPLVENALRHGIADRERDGLVTIRAAASEGWLALSVADNGSGSDGEPIRALVEGTGLGNTRRRLERLYGSDHELSVRGVAGGGTCAALRIPLRRTAEGAP